jgi:hypothetical protein
MPEDRTPTAGPEMAALAEDTARPTPATQR